MLVKFNRKKKQKNVLAFLTLKKDKRQPTIHVFFFFIIFTIHTPNTFMALYYVLGLIYDATLQ